MTNHPLLKKKGHIFWIILHFFFFYSKKIFLLIKKISPFSDYAVELITICFIIILVTRIELWLFLDRMLFLFIALQNMSFVTKSVTYMKFNIYRMFKYSPSRFNEAFK